MSGIFGLYDKTGRIDLAAIEQRVRNFRVPDTSPHKIECIRRGPGLFGRYYLGVIQQPEIDRQQETSSIIVTTGYRVGDFPAPKVAGSPNSGFDRKTLDALERYIRQNDAAPFADFDGAFQILHCSPNGRSLTIVVDRCGLQPLYYFDGPDCLVFASDFSLLFTLLGRTPEVDHKSLAELFEIGMVAGDRTLFSGVRVFPAGSIARYTDDKLTVRRYWRPVYADDREGFNGRTAMDLLDRALRKSVRERAALCGNTSVLLSGGMDSRLLLAAAVGEGLTVPACTFGDKDSPDHRIAAEVAGRLGVEHRRFIDEPLPTAMFFETGVRQTGGMGNPVDFTGMIHLPDIARLSPVVFNGYGGNNLLGYLAFDLLRFRFPRSRDCLGRWLGGKLNPGWGFEELKHIRQSLAPQVSEFAVRVSDFWKKYRNRSAITLLYQFLTEEKARRIDLLGVMADTIHLEPVAPLYGNEVMDIALSIPPRERLLARFYRRFLSSRYPDVAGIEYSRTGQPANASTARIVLSKVRGRLSRAGPADVWADWFRDDLREYVGDHLLSGQSRIGELLGQDFVKTMVEDFLHGQSPRARVVGQLLGCEIFLRIFPSVSGK